MIPDKLWDKINAILTNEKPNNTTGHTIIPYRKVMDDILYFLRTGCKLKMLPPKEYGSGSLYSLQFVFLLDFFFFFSLELSDNICSTK
jgi:transposase